MKPLSWLKDWLDSCIEDRNIETKKLQAKSEKLAKAYTGSGRLVQFEEEFMESIKEKYEHQQLEQAIELANKIYGIHS